MNELIAQFNRSTCIEYTKTACNYDIEYDEFINGVRAKQYIQCGALIGEILGDPKYIWDMRHSEFIFIDEDMVVDVSKVLPRQILSFIREDNQSEYPYNCEIIVKDTPNELRFFLCATRVIYPNEEIVYKITR